MIRSLTAVLCITAIAAIAVFPGAAVHFLLPPVTLGTTIVFGELPCLTDLTATVAPLTSLLALTSSRHLARASLPHLAQ
jgi:hypothetical protein